MEFINEDYINYLLESEELLDENYQRDLIQKGAEAKGLNLKEAAALLNINSPEILEELHHTAKKVKEKIYLVIDLCCLLHFTLQMFALIIVCIVPSEKIIKN